MEPSPAAAGGASASSANQRTRIVDYVVILGYDQGCHESNISYEDCKDRLMRRRHRYRPGAGNNSSSGLGPDVQSPPGASGGAGKLIQRFPVVPWKDVPFIDGLEPFCQPNGWCLKTERGEPQFHIAVLTSMTGNRHYCAVLSFDEAVVRADVSKPATDLGDEMDEQDVNEDLQQGGPLSLSLKSHPGHMVPGVSLPSMAHDAILFAPKSILLLSRHDDPEVLRNILTVLYTAYSECLVGPGGERVRLESLIGTLLGSVFVPAPGGPQIRFSLGAGDKLSLQPPVHASVPATGTKVAVLFQQLGIRSVLTLFCAAMTELKILFYSHSYNRLTEACTALVALMYPMKYMHVFIPILPASVGELWSSPTPFIIGVHASREDEISDLLDVVRVDLDGGSITVPENMTIHMLPQEMLNKVQSELSSVLHPELAVADLAFPNSHQPMMKKPLVSLDKELRAVMLRLMIRLLDGYRSCLMLVRIHPQPYITFHRAAFLGLRGFADSEFARRMLDCMFFNTFVSERGSPWRQCDIFDEAYALHGEQKRLEKEEPRKTLKHIKVLAEEFFRNENPLTTLNQPYAQKIPHPAEGAMHRVHQPVFPHLDEDFVSEVIQRGLEKYQLEQKNVPAVTVNKKLVPNGQAFLGARGSSNGTLIVSNTARRLEVLRSCISHIFDNKISDAKKTFPSVMSTLKTRQARLVLVEELESRKTSTQVLLENTQFDMLVRMMNAALQDDSDMDMHGIASALLPLSTVFGRKLSKGVSQFAYTLIQDHAVWHNQAFWEAAFFSDVQIGIKNLYLGLQDLNSNEKPLSDTSSNGHGRTSVSSITSVPGKEGNGLTDRTVLELAAQEVKNWNRLAESAQSERIKAEEATIFSQTLTYVNYMISILCPLELANASKRTNGRRYNDDYENVSNSISNSMAESDSIDRESGFEEQEIPNSAQHVIKTVLRFADKVGSESGMTPDHLRTLDPLIRSSVAMHAENLEEVFRQTKRLPPIQKPKINNPSLLPGEEFVIPNGLRVYLLSDGRENDLPSGVPLLPAEGALFLTNYRLIFKGNPIDPFASEYIVTRFFPVTSLTKEKRFTLNEYLTVIEQQLREGIQLRSNTFQLIRAAFDDEVTMDDVENFRKSIARVQYPDHISHLFAFRGNHSLLTEHHDKGKGDKNAKYASIRGFASKTLKNVSKVTGYQKKKKPNKYFLPNMMPTPGRLSIAELTNHNEGKTIREEDEGSETGDLHMPMYSSNSLSATTKSKTLESLMERSYFKDWIRIGLLPPDYVLSTGKHHHNDSFRVSVVNHRYNVSPSYPALLLVPSTITDESLKRYSRCHRQARFPTITWKHPTNHALILRGSGFHSKGVMGMIRRHQDGATSSSHTREEQPTSVEAELYVTAVIKATPRAILRPDSAWHLSGSQMSINSLMVPGEQHSTIHNYPTLTPSSGRKFNPLTKAMDTLTRSAQPPKMSRMSLSSLKGNKTLGSQTSLTSSGGYRGSYRLSDSGEPSNELGSVLSRTALYIFGDKNQAHKGMKLDASKTEFIPFEYPGPRSIRASFKKLMRACVPTSHPNLSAHPEHAFLKQVEASEWLLNLSALLQISGAVVNLIDMQGASVMLCFEDGWDITPQLTSLALLCLDPHYRTLEGFRVLVEKEWLSVGHRFHYRNNLTNTNQDYGFTPLFLQFLDAVHQVLAQFPTHFEFNEYYLKFLAYHHVSCRFRTFLFDCEGQRAEAGLLAQDDCKRGSFPGRHHRSGYVDSHSSDEEIYPGTSGPGGPVGSRSNGGTLTGSANYGVNVFDYIELHAAKTPVFYNFSYARDMSPAAATEVLRPNFSISDLKIWDYYLREELRHGPSYDLELREFDLQQEDELNCSNDAVSLSLGVDNGKRALIAGYDDLQRVSVDLCSALLNEISVVESELGHLPNRWKTTWENLDVPPVLPPRTQSHAHPVALTTPSMTAKSHCRQLHKHSTLELIMKGRLGSTGAGGNAAVGGGAGGTAGETFAASHHFERHNYPTPTTCEVCSGLLWGPVMPGFRCSDCGYNCHEKCVDVVTHACTSRYKTSAGAGVGGGVGVGMVRDPTADNLHQLDRELETPGGGARPRTAEDDLYSQFSATHDENSQIIRQGYLQKQANFKIKGWKQRWFQLDATKHQLKYFDTREDFQCKGHIDLSEVTQVVEGYSTPGAPKRHEDGCFFDLHTVKRTYCFCAESRESAHDWIQKIQSCLSS